jgi:TonB family protein
MTSASRSPIAVHPDTAPRRSGPARSAAGAAISVGLHLLCLTVVVTALEAGTVDRPRSPERPFTFVMVTRELPRVLVPVPASAPDTAAPDPLEASPVDARVPTPELPAPEPIDVAGVVDADPPAPPALPDPLDPAPDPVPAFESAIAARAPAGAGAAGPVLGAFDRPVGPAPAAVGAADGAAVRAAGFAAAAPPPALHPPPVSVVANAGFDLAPARSARPAGRPVATADAPVEVVFKPAPDYTEEARSLGVEGEVVLEVVFAASSEVRVLRVVHGLGHGLDEAAVRAALCIRFKPAARDGLAVDCRATVRIVFRLSSLS